MPQLNGDLTASEIVDVVTAHCHQNREIVTDVLNAVWRLTNRPICLSVHDLKCHACGAPMNTEPDGSGLYCTANPSPTHSPSAMRYIVPSVDPRVAASIQDVDIDQARAAMKHRGPPPTQML